jgi:hypothetical protein
MPFCDVRIKDQGLVPISADRYADLDIHVGGSNKPDETSLFGNGAVRRGAC